MKPHASQHFSEKGAQALKGVGYLLSDSLLSTNSPPRLRGQQPSCPAEALALLAPSLPFAVDPDGAMTFLWMQVECAEF